MRSADALPHSWEVTSDSIAAFVAGALDAGRLVLIKPAAERSTPWTATSERRCRRECPDLIVGWERLEELSDWLSELDRCRRTRGSSPGRSACG